MIDWLAGGFDLVGCYIVGDKKKIGFVLNVVGNLGWVYVALSTKIYGLLLVVLPALVLNVRNYRKWSKG